MIRSKYRIAFLIDYLITEYTALVLQGIKAACKQFDIELVILPVGELHNYGSLYDYQYVAITALLKKENIDGIIFPAGTQMHFLSKHELEEYICRFQPLPIVNISSSLGDLPSVQVDCYHAYKDIITNLIKYENCRRFGIMNVFSNSSEIKNRYDAINKILSESGIPSENIITWYANYDYSMAVTELEKYYSAKKKLEFDALLCMNDEMAFAALDFCNRNNIRVPDDVCIVGFDNVQRSTLSIPNLTSIDQSLMEQGFSAVQAMKSILENGNVPEIPLIDAKAVWRESCCRNKDALIEETAYLKNETSPVYDKAKYASGEWYQKKFQLYQVTKLYTELQSDITIDQLSARLNKDLKSFGITASAIVLYEKPIEKPSPFEDFSLPEKAYVFSAFDYATGVDTVDNKKREIFNPNEKMIPDGLIKFDSDGMFAIPIFHTTVQYGYIFLRIGEYDVAIYDLLTKILSSIIASVFSYTIEQKERMAFSDRYTSLDLVARTDELTGLNNRRGLFEYGQSLLNIGQAMEHEGLVIFSDLDKLKKINDNYGHEAGDIAIIEESKIFKKSFRSNDLIARIGGDEFAMICPGLTVEKYLEIRKKIDEECQNWTEKYSPGYKLSTSMGYVQYPAEDGGYILAKLLSLADKELYKEKALKKQNQ